MKNRSMHARKAVTSNMVIGVDIDGVVLDFVGAFIRTVTKHGYSLKKDQVYCYDLSQVLGISKDLASKWIEETLCQNQFDLIEGARDAISKLAERHKILLITSQRRVFREKTAAVLQRHGVPFHVLGFVDFLKKRSVVPTPDVFVEDSVEEAIELSSAVKRVFLFDQPWNRGSLNILNSFERVYSWREIVQKIENLSLSEQVDTQLVQGETGRAKAR